MQTDRQSAGFSLVEMIIVMVIVGILLSVSFVVGGRAKRNAGEEKTRAHMRQAISVIQKARDANQVPLITLAPAVADMESACGGDLDQVDSADFGGACRAAWDASVAALASYAGSANAAREMLTDGWGRPIVLDLQDGADPGTCAEDTLRSAGVGGTWDKPVSLSAHRSGYDPGCP